MSSNDMLVEMLKTVNGLRDDMKENRKEILTIVNDLKEEVKENRKEIQESREIEESHWQENLRRWEENDRRWEKYETNRKEDRKFLLDTLTVYDISISEQLGDPNVEKMRKIVI